MSSIILTLLRCALSTPFASSFARMLSLFITIGKIIDGKVLYVHGGLSPEICALDQIDVLSRA
jgi:diadenosine tetraphosphatase ApaH/serine/threonine PP2A family protein phosphatase